MFALVDDLGRLSLFGCGVSPDAFTAAPSSQFFPTEWNELVFDAHRNALDAVTQRPPHLAPRDQIVSIERRPYARITLQDFALSIPIDCDESQRVRQQEIFVRQAREEFAQFHLEKRTTPPGIAPRHTRSRRKRLLYGSDVEEATAAIENGDAMNLGIESDDEPFQASSQSETDAEVGVTNSDDENAEQGPYNLRNRRLATPAQRSPRALQRSRRAAAAAAAHQSYYHERDQIYHPSQSNGRPRPRRRLVIADSSSENEQAFEEHLQVAETPDWLTVRDRQTFTYLPQIYDVVAYFPEGHRQFLEREQDPKYHRNLPWHTERSLDSVVFGQVVGLNFVPGAPASCCLELLVLPRAEVQESMPPPAQLPPSAKKIQVCFYDMENQPEFIIPYCRYRWSVLPVQRYRVGEVVRVVFNAEEAYEARVVKIKVPSGRIPDFPWQCYMVEWLSLSEDPEYFNPWELETIIEEDAPERTRYLCEEHIGVEVLRALDEGIKKLLTEQVAAPFRKPVDLWEFANYLDYVAYPMDLSLLHQRIINGYYRRVEALEWDAKLLFENAFAYNCPESEIVKDAGQVVGELMRLLKRAERGARRLRSDQALASPARVTTPAPIPSASVATWARSSVADRQERARRRAAAGVGLPSPSFSPLSSPQGAFQRFNPRRRGTTPRLFERSQARDGLSRSAAPPKRKRNTPQLELSSSSENDADSDEYSDPGKERIEAPRQSSNSSESPADRKQRSRRFTRNSTRQNHRDQRPYQIRAAVFDVLRSSVPQRRSARLTH